MSPLKIIRAWKDEGGGCSLPALWRERHRATASAAVPRGRRLSIALTVAAAVLLASAAHAQGTPPTQVRQSMEQQIAVGGSDTLYYWWDVDGWGVFRVQTVAHHLTGDVIKVRLWQNGWVFNGSGFQALDGTLFFGLQNNNLFRIALPGFGTYHRTGSPERQGQFLLRLP